MIVEVDNSFKKDFKRLKNKEIENRIIEKINLLERTESIEFFPNIKKLK